MTDTIYTQEVGKYHAQKTVGGWTVVFISDRNTARPVDGGKVHESRQNAYAKAKRLNDAKGYVTLLSEQAPRANESAAQRWGSSTDGTEMVVWKKSDGWYGCMRGIYKGNGFESEDDGPYPTREAAEATQRDYYAEDRTQDERKLYEDDLLDYHEA